jgi:hypothetical protein
MQTNRSHRLPFSLFTSCSSTSTSWGLTTPPPCSLSPEKLPPSPHLSLSLPLS